MASQENTVPTEVENVETELVAQLLGTDPWMRFDVWSARAWDAAEKAVSIAEGVSAGSDDGMDGRVLAAFHASQIAKDFAEMVNPLFAATCDSRSSTLPSDAQARAIMSLVMDDDDD